MAFSYYDDQRDIHNTKSASANFIVRLAKLLKIIMAYAILESLLEVSHSPILESLASNVLELRRFCMLWTSILKVMLLVIPVVFDIISNH